MDKKKTRIKFQDEWYVRVHQLARQGVELSGIAKTLGVSMSLINKWMDTKPAFRKAFEEGRRPREGRKAKGGYDGFRDFVYGRLPKNVQKFWDRLEGVEKSEDREAKESLLEEIHGLGRRMKQHLFIHALVHYNFMPSLAMRLLGLSQAEVKQWMDGDPGFAGLVNGIQEHKKDFFESCLINLCRQGDTSAIIFANRTINRDRGYNDKVTVDVNQRMDVRHTVKVEDLPLEVRKALLETYRQKQGLLEDKSDIVDAEVA